jgi:succinate-semialdehyde dehydrogenase/glutarate-semialdehyde dehydrogenase
MAGNPILLKHAPNVSGCALAIEREWRRAGAEAGLFQVLLIEERQVARVIADPRLAGVTLTGSEAAGRAVAALAGRHLKKTVLELGGSDAFLVLADAPVQEVAERAAEARTVNSGQSCIAAKRIIVEKAIAREFVAAFTEAMAARKVGDPFAADTDIGPLARADLRRRLHQQVEASVAGGAKLLLGGRPLAGPGYYYPPTVLLGARRGTPAYEEELFGPVASVLVARDVEQAVAIANDSRFGLGASIWTRDLERAERLVPRLEAGVVHINETVKSDPRLPFGGVKHSGYGRELGSYGIKEFVNIKSVVVQRL